MVLKIENDYFVHHIFVLILEDIFSLEQVMIAYVNMNNVFINLNVKEKLNHFFDQTNKYYFVNHGHILSRQDQCISRSVFFYENILFVKYFLSV